MIGEISLFGITLNTASVHSLVIAIHTIIALRPLNRRFFTVRDQVLNDDRRKQPDR